MTPSELGLMRHGSRRLLRFGRAREGATAIEFALVAVPFFMVIGWILEIGIMLFTEYALQNAVQDASRTIRTGAAATMTGPQFLQEVCNNGSVVNDCGARLGIAVESAGTFAGITVPAIDTIGPGVQSFNSGGPEAAVTVIATYDWEFIFPFMQPLSNVAGGNARRLHGMAVFRSEPF